MYELEMAKKIRELEKEIQYLKTLEKAKAMVPPSDYVDLTTDQNIGGVKGFTSFPLTPSSAPTQDYEVANKEYVDNAVNAVGTWQDWIPTQSGWSDVNMLTRYCLIGKTCFFTVDVVSGTSNSALLLISAPLAKIGNVGGVNAMAMDNGVLIPSASRYWIDGNNRIQAYTDMGSGAWTASGTKRVRIFGFYEVDDD